MGSPMPHLQIPSIRTEVSGRTRAALSRRLPGNRDNHSSISVGRFPWYGPGAYRPLTSGLAERIIKFTARDIGGPQPPATVSGSPRRVVSEPFISCILHQRSSTAMQIDANRSLRHDALHKPRATLNTPWSLPTLSAKPRHEMTTATAPTTE